VPRSRAHGADAEKIVNTDFDVQPGVIEANRSVILAGSRTVR